MTDVENKHKVFEYNVGVGAMRGELSSLLTREVRKNTVPLPWFKNMYGQKHWFGISGIIDSGVNEGREIRIRPVMKTTDTGLTDTEIMEMIRKTVGSSDISIYLYGKPNEGDSNKAVLLEGYRFGRESGSFDRLPTQIPVEPDNIDDCLTEVKEWLRVVK